MKNITHRLFMPLINQVRRDLYDFRYPSNRNPGPNPQDYAESCAWYKTLVIPELVWDKEIQLEVEWNKEI